MKPLYLKSLYLKSLYLKPLYLKLLCLQHNPPQVLLSICFPHTQIFRIDTGHCKYSLKKSFFYYIL